MNECVEGESELQPKDTLKTIPWNIPFKIFHVILECEQVFPDSFNYLLSYAHYRSKHRRRWVKEAFAARQRLLFVDSGLLTGAREVGRKFIDLQDDVVAFAEECGADWVAMMDVPTVPKVLRPLEMSPEEAFRFHMRNVERFARLETPLRKVFVVQGTDLESYRRCCQAMRDFVSSADVVAIGSIMTEQRADFVAAVCRIVKEFFPENDVHLFGVTSPRIAGAAYPLGATSCDSAIANLMRSLGRLISFKRGAQGEYVIERFKLYKLTSGERVSICGKLRSGMHFFNLSMLEVAIYLEIERALKSMEERGQGAASFSSWEDLPLFQESCEVVP